MTLVSLVGSAAYIVAGFVAGFSMCVGSVTELTRSSREVVVLRLCGVMLRCVERRYWCLIADSSSSSLSGWVGSTFFKVSE